jgi:hypothetical protein
MFSTKINDLTIWHDVPSLGVAVGDNILALIQLYANRAVLKEIPPITLSGQDWDKSWNQLSAKEGCTGNSGPSRQEISNGIRPYQCLFITAPTGHYCKEPHLTNIECTIAHEICHLRWPNLEHGPEFFARVHALLLGAVFSTRGRWVRPTQITMEKARLEMRDWYKKLLKI